MEIEVEGGEKGELNEEVLQRMRALSATKGDWEANDKAEFAGLVANNVEELMGLVELGLDAEELGAALQMALDALDNMVSLPMPEDWRETLLAKYPRALKVLRERA